ncbi:hypothetical protein ACHAXS_003501 [Conticribra weissflogii]
MKLIQIEDEGKLRSDAHTTQSSPVDLDGLQKTLDNATRAKNKTEWDNEPKIIVAMPLSVSNEVKFERESSEQSLTWRGKKTLLRRPMLQNGNTPRSALFLRNRIKMGELNFAAAAPSLRKLHDAVNHTNNYNSTVAYLHQSPHSSLSGDSASQNAGQRTGSLLLYIIMILILAPCLAAAVAQAVYTWKKRARDRRERQLAAVSTNPGGRRLILDEILKGNSRAVTSDEVSPRKKRVLVKKRRKKTPAERLREKGSKCCVDAEEIDQSDAKSMSYVAELKKKDHGNENKNNKAEPWWDVEEVLSDGRKLSKSKDDLDLDMERGGRIVICLSKDLEVDAGDSEEPNSLKKMDELPGMKRNLFLNYDHSVDKCSTLDENNENQSKKDCADYDGSITSHEEDASCTVDMPSMPPPLPQVISFDAEEERASTGINENDGDEVACHVDDTVEESTSTNNSINKNDENKKLESNPDGIADVFHKCEKSIFRSTYDCVHTNRPGDHVDCPVASLIPDLNEMDSDSPAVKLKPQIHVHITDNEVVQRTNWSQTNEESNTTSSKATASSHDKPSMQAASNFNEAEPATERVQAFRAFSRKSDTSEEVSSIVQSSYGLILPALSEEHDDWETESKGPDRDNPDAKNIFRDYSESEVQNHGGIKAKASSVTDVPSKIDSRENNPITGQDTSSTSMAFPPDLIDSSSTTAADILPSYRLERSLSMSSSLNKPIALKPVESYVTDASSVSYFSYEDVSIDENELEMCAICLCAYGTCHNFVCYPYFS